MVLTLIALVLLLVGVAAMLRSADASTTLVGNLAFRRDLTNRSEIAIATARAALATGALGDADVPASNYSASRLANPSGSGAGVPAVLISNSAYTTKTYACLPATCVADSDGILLRWVIDRQCTTSGTPFSSDTCAQLTSPSDGSGTSWVSPTKGASRAMYRITVRVTGPRNTEAYFQTTAG